jgi:hypothetical protein
MIIFSNPRSMGFYFRDHVQVLKWYSDANVYKAERNRQGVFYSQFLYYYLD